MARTPPLPPSIGLPRDTGGKPPADQTQSSSASGNNNSHSRPWITSAAQFIKRHLPPRAADNLTPNPRPILQPPQLNLSKEAIEEVTAVAENIDNILHKNVYGKPYILGPDSKDLSEVLSLMMKVNPSEQRILLELLNQKSISFASLIKRFADEPEIKHGCVDIIKHYRKNLTAEECDKTGSLLEGLYADDENSIILADARRELQSRFTAK